MYGSSRLQKPPRLPASSYMASGWGIFLVSFTSLGEYLNSCTTYINMSQIGRILGPAGRPTPCGNSSYNFTMMILNTRSSKERVVSHKRHKLRPKGLHQVQLGPPAMTNQRVKTQTDLRDNMQPSTNVSEQ